MDSVADFPISEQLASNRALVTQLKGRGENVKGQAAHVGTGFPLRRFNLDISDGKLPTNNNIFSTFSPCIIV